ncbi:hypothetical protein C485_11233 [Natrinema altunense JCM 12890]|uniref:Uncharacterized protein n=1 Tax=Natrinema altunense (strain JCM 12890 / CGMCC 1.3731 / AJ2) TaxID=1227494 RepID=L9ZH02_NATA2|nr:hypothetical protein C485_11233 [Natrinema altunense JCM 12890]
MTVAAPTVSYDSLTDGTLPVVPDEVWAAEVTDEAERPAVFFTAIPVGPSVRATRPVFGWTRPGPCPNWKSSRTVMYG